jgi:hypothetical protein
LLDADPRGSHCPVRRAKGGRARTPGFARGRRSAVLARFEILGREIVPAGESVRLARAGIRMREWVHERTRMVLPHRRTRPPRAGRPRRPAPRRRRVRRPGGVPAARLLEPLRFLAPGGRPVPGVRLLPAGGRPDGPALARDRGAGSRRTAVHHDGERAGEGDHRGEPHRGAAHGADGIGASDRPTGWTSRDPPGSGRTRTGATADRCGTDDVSGDPAPRHRLTGVRGVAEEGEGRAVARSTGSE